MALDTLLTQPEGLEYAPESSTLPNRMFINLMAYNGAPTVAVSPLAGRWATHTYDSAATVLTAGYLDSVALNAAQSSTLGYFKYLPGSFWRVVCNVGSSTPDIRFIWCQLKWLGDFDAAGYPIYNADTTGANSTQLVQVNLGTGPGPETGVTSFNTRTGVVSPSSGDYNVEQVTGAAPLSAPSFTGGVTIAGGCSITGGASVTGSGVVYGTLTAGNLTVSQNAEIIGNLSLTTAASRLQIASGVNSSIGTLTLNGATPVVVDTAAVTATSLIFLARQAAGGTMGEYEVSARSAGTSFTVTGTALDTSTLAYLIIN